MCFKTNSIIIVELFIFSMTILLFTEISSIGLRSDNFFAQIYAKEGSKEIIKYNAAMEINQSYLL